MNNEKLYRMYNLRRHQIHAVNKAVIDLDITITVAIESALKMTYDEDERLHLLELLITDMIVVFIDALFLNSFGFCLKF
jgi:hypothetical protein